MLFHSSEVPVAYSMVPIAEGQLTPIRTVYQSFLCYWAAFNDIYTTVYKRCRQNGTSLSERDRVLKAVSCLDTDLKHWLIMHDSTHFFVCRTPRYDRQPVKRNISGQRLNGVINVGKTTDGKNPRYEGIDIEDYERYCNDETARACLRDELSKQIGGVLYGVRNNLFHGGKRADVFDDFDVVKRAIPLLSKIVLSFLSPQEIQEFEQKALIENARAS